MAKSNDFFLFGKHWIMFISLIVHCVECLHNSIQKDLSVHVTLFVVTSYDSLWQIVHSYIAQIYFLYRFFSIFASIV
jgi:hypothetical protein